MRATNGFYNACWKSAKKLNSIQEDSEKLLVIVRWFKNKNIKTSQRVKENLRKSKAFCEKDIYIYIYTYMYIY
jgi:hypothetical protein